MNLLGFLVGFAFPFVAAFRGRGSAGVAVLLAWAGIFLWAVVFSLGVPGVVYIFSHELAREMQATWLPTPQGIPLVAVLGWLMPLMAAFGGHFFRWLLQTLWPAALVRLVPTAKAAGTDSHEKPRS
jgi:ABC-type proline/glycine betaine transport system permease subunit